MRKLDKKCLKCPIRKFSVQAVQLLRCFYELEQDILTTLDNFETSIYCYREVEKGVLYDEYSRRSDNS